MKRFGWIVLFALSVGFCSACHAVTPGPCTTGSTAAVIVMTDEETTEAESETAAVPESSETSLEETTQETAEGELVRATSAVNIRDAADTDSNVVGTLSKGEEITRVGTAGGWSIVIFEGEECYIYSKYLETAE